MNVTQEQLNIKDEALLAAINEVLAKYNINTPLRIQHFLAQIYTESGGLTVFKENLNYSNTGLRRVFGKYFTELQALQYQRQPEKIANRVYANRLGNGPESSGDGWKYRGKGAIQITGKANYQSLSNDLGIDFVTNPQLLETIPYSIISAGWYWDKAKLNVIADKDDVMAVSKKVNGGTNGLQERIKWLEHFKKVIK
jgi:putative chitinase